MDSKTELLDLVNALDHQPDEVNIDDLMEHDIEDLQMKFGLEPAHTFLLYMVIQELTDSTFTVMTTVLNRL